MEKYEWEEFILLLIVFLIGVTIGVASERNSDLGLFENKPERPVIYDKEIEIIGECKTWFNTSIGDNCELSEGEYSQEYANEFHLTTRHYKLWNCEIGKPIEKQTCERKRGDLNWNCWESEKTK